VSSLLDHPKEAGEPLASSRAISVASSMTSSSLTILITNPQAMACSEEIGRSNASISSGRPSPTSLGSTNEPPPSMFSPLDVYACRKKVDLAITLKSYASANEKPLPAAAPLIAAITGLGIRRIS